MGVVAGRPDTALVVEDDADHFVRIVGQLDQVEIAGIDIAMPLLQLALHPMQQSFPVFGAEQDERELRDALGLDERDDFKQLIERAKPAGHVNEAEAVFREADLARKKIVEVQRKVGVAVALLLAGQFDVQADGFTAALRRALVGGLHDARAAAGNDAELVPGKFPGNVMRGAVILVAGLHPRRAENAHGGAGLGKRQERVHEFGHDAENAPRIFAHMKSGVTHGGSITRRRRETSRVGKQSRQGHAILKNWAMWLAKNKSRRIMDRAMSVQKTDSFAFGQACEATAKAAVSRHARLWWMALLTVLGLLLGAGAPPVFAIAPSAPTNLRVDDVTAPVGNEAVPYFGWFDNDPNANEIQTGYEILVATNAADLAANFGDVWDSGEVLSSSENHVVYAGAPLTADTAYFWKVRTWNREGNAGPYSTNTTFAAGLLANSDWSGASWIKRNTTISDDYTYYRKSTNLPAGTVTRATVYVTSVHKYALYVNGTLVGKGPAYAYAQFQYYNAYDITGLVTPGATNLFAIFNHWFGGGQGRPTSARGVLMEAIIHYADGTSVVVGTDGTWLQSQATSWIVSSPSPAARGGEGDGYVERIDSRNLMPTWFMPGFDDSAWTTATVIGSQPIRRGLARSGPTCRASSRRCSRPCRSQTWAAANTWWIWARCMPVCRASSFPAAPPAL